MFCFVETVTGSDLFIIILEIACVVFDQSEPLPVSIVTWLCTHGTTHFGLSVTTSTFVWICLPYLLNVGRHVCPLSGLGSVGGCCVGHAAPPRAEEHRVKCGY